MKLNRDVIRTAVQAAQWLAMKDALEGVVREKKYAGDQHRRNVEWALKLMTNIESDTNARMRDFVTPETVKKFMRQ